MMSGGERASSAPCFLFSYSFCASARTVDCGSSDAMRTEGDGIRKQQLQSISVASAQSAATCISSAAAAGPPRGQPPPSTPTTVPRCRLYRAWRGRGPATVSVHAAQLHGQREPLGLVCPAAPRLVSLALMARTKSSLATPPKSDRRPEKLGGQSSSTKDRLARKGRESPHPPASPEEYVVEAILGEKKIGGELRYLVKWEGYGQEDNTWEPEEHLVKRALCAASLRIICE
eukprot:6183683-Pleurochrysis_carterae.AAC.3